jgi:hypothetical protein
MTDSLADLSSALAGRYRVERELATGGMATVTLRTISGTTVRSQSRS